MSIQKNRSHYGRTLYPDLKTIERSITPGDEETFLKLVTCDLTKVELEWAESPEKSYPRQDAVLAVHWHPEHVPLSSIAKRVENLYPNRKTELIIPTQHNEITYWGDYAGVEIDCFSRGFNRKVQLLLHFHKERIIEDKALVMKSMLDHTFKYRTSQLFDFLDTLIEPEYSDRLQAAAAQTAANEDLVEFCRIYAAKLRALIEKNEYRTPRMMIKNKLFTNFIDTLNEIYDPRLISKAQIFLKAVKEIVKAAFPLKYFYRTSEVIEEARSLGAGIVIPHPEQFWPILLADYDVDGYEVWNPQSQQYTEFLINAVNRGNHCRKSGSRPILVFMGDDTHFSEKIKPPHLRNPEKSSRELGYQPAWEDLSICKSLIMSGVDRRGLIREYKARLGA